LLFAIFGVKYEVVIELVALKFDLSMRKIILLLGFMFLSVLCFCQQKDYFINLTGDTIFGEIKYFRETRKNGKTFKFVSDKKEKITFHTKTAKTLFYEGHRWIIRPINPWKPNPKRIDFMSVLAEKKDYLICRREYTISTMMMPGSFYLPGENTFVNYYLYKGDIFIDEFTKKNHDKLLTEYFGDCEQMIKEMEQNKKAYFEDLCEVYNTNCK